MTPTPDEIPADIVEVISEAEDSTKANPEDVTLKGVTDALERKQVIFYGIGALSLFQVILTVCFANKILSAAASDRTKFDVRVLFVLGVFAIPSTLFILALIRAAFQSEAGSEKKSDESVIGHLKDVSFKFFDKSG